MNYLILAYIKNKVKSNKNLTQIKYKSIEIVSICYYETECFIIVFGHRRYLMLI